MRVLLLGLGLMLSLSGCAVPTAVTIASFAADGVSYIATGKSTTDHALSVLAQEDCAMMRALEERAICTPERKLRVLTATAEPDGIASTGRERHTGKTHRDAERARSHRQTGASQGTPADPSTACHGPAGVGIVFRHGRNAARGPMRPGPRRLNQPHRRLCSSIPTRRRVGQCQSRLKYRATGHRS